MPYNELLGVLRKGGIFSKSLGCVKKIVSYLRKILHMLLFGGYLLVFESFLKTFFFSISVVKVVGRCSRVIQEVLIKVVLEFIFIYK